jgi:glycosyltransferase involved in cell wall biosynthesis
MIKEVIFFSNGSADSASTWSNIPYLFSKTLEKKGIKVRKVNLFLHPYLYNFYDLFIRRLLKLLYLPFGIVPNYSSHTRWYEYLGNKAIKKAVRLYKNADYCIFINYLFYNQYSDLPSLLLSDWPTTFDIQKSGRQPNVMDRRLLAQESKAINNATHVISIFQVRADAMKHDYPNANISFLGGNVINNFYDKDLDVKSILDIKTKSNSILFIGKPDRYKESAKKVIAAYEILRQDNPDLNLNIIGMTDDDLGRKSNDVHAFGFIHKDVPSERDLYYKLLIEAKVLVNPTPKWAAYSSLIEAMYFYTPVVVTPFVDFVAEFGENINFGIYNNDFTVDCIANNIKSLISTMNYQKMCNFAHENVKDYSWNSYIDKIINLIDK